MTVLQNIIDNLQRLVDSRSVAFDDVAAFHPTPDQPQNHVGRACTGNGLRVTTFSTSIAGPPTLECIENDGRRVTEQLCLVGWVAAEFDRRNVLELYGIDLRFAIHNPKTERWERCLFSYQLADMLEALSAEGEFPFAFEVTPSQGEVDWIDLEARGQSTRPVLALRMYLIPASAESLAAVANDDRMRVRRGQPRNEAEDSAGSRK